MNEKIGLFMDSFPILHKGHELCIKYAKSKVDRLITVIYNSESSKIPLQIRTDWLRRIYPDMEIIASWIDFEGNQTSEVQIELLKKILKERKISEFATTENGLEHLCKTFGCEDIIKQSIKEKMQKAVSIIQQNSYKGLGYVDDIVYRDLITKVAFVGAQSTGKSTIAEAMAKKYNTSFMYEYGRYHWDVYQKDRIETIEQIEEITERHIAMEDERIKTANNFFFSDTCPIVTLRYAYDWHGKASEKLLKYAGEAEKRYDIFFLCGDDIPYADTPERDGIEQRKSFQSQIKSELLLRKIPYIELQGNLQERMDIVSRVLDNYQKYTSLGINIEKSLNKGIKCQEER